MTQFKSYIFRFQALVLAAFVVMLSTGFTYQWEACIYAEAPPVCKVVEENTSCCCIAPTETPKCLCADMSHNTCDFSFSKYVQFDFEALTSDFEEFVPDVGFPSAGDAFLFSEEALGPLQVRIADYSLPPPKSVREILCITQAFLI